MNDAFGNLVMRAVASTAIVMVVGCGSAEPGPSIAPLASSNSAKPTTSPTVQSASVAPPSAEPLDEPAPLVIGPLHLAITSPRPPSWMAVEGGPVVLMGKSLLAFDVDRGAFIERPELQTGFETTKLGGTMVGRLSGDLWFAEWGSPSRVLRRPAGGTWQTVQTIDGEVDLLPLGEKSVLAKVRKGDVFLRFEVFGDPPLPMAPRVPKATSPCKLDLDGRGFATLADGTVVAGDACHVVWEPKTGKALVKRELGGAVVAMKPASGTSIVLYGNRLGRLTPVIAFGDGARWTPIDTSKLADKTMIRDVARTPDGTIWIVAERDSEPARLWRSPSNGNDWERLPMSMGTTDHEEDRHTDVLSVDVVDGEVWVRAQHASKIEGPYVTSIFTTRPTKRVLRM